MSADVIKCNACMLYGGVVVGGGGGLSEFGDWNKKKEVKKESRVKVSNDDDSSTSNILDGMIQIQL